MILPGPSMDTRPRTFVGKLPTRVPVMVTVRGDRAELAFKHDDRWTAPIELTEETA